jgi:hypothetical protein
MEERAYKRTKKRTRRRRRIDGGQAMLPDWVQERARELASSSFSFFSPHSHLHCQQYQHHLCRHFSRHPLLFLFLLRLVLLRFLLVLMLLLL